MRLILSLSSIWCLTLMVLAPAAAPAADGPFGLRLTHALADPDASAWRADGTLAVWVRFDDRRLSVAARELALAQAEATLPPRTLARRAKMRRDQGRLVDNRDLPLDPEHVAGVVATGARIRQPSRWFNAVSVEATPFQIDALARLPYVRSLELVAQFNRSNPRIAPSDDHLASRRLDESAAASRDRWNLDYGGSTAGLEQINVPPVHDEGLSGTGVLVALLDSGFKRHHPALAGVDVVAQWDFINDDDVVENEPGDHEWQDRHGTHVLSTIMGYLPGELVGPAYGASVILCKTEDVGDETPIEEDYWVAAIEWVETLGADIVSSSLGYYYWYEYSDLDGDTALVTIAADRAVELGMCVFTSAGNERDNEDWPHVTAPADGHSVVAMGAVDLDGVLASFSSPGPTFDGRIKPDVVAQGVGNFVVNWYDDTNYQVVNGTSFAAPLVAGVAALMLERVPSLDPIQVREALRQTADRAASPDNDYGWGLIDALAAARYWGPAIEHTPLADTEDLVGPYTVTATITDRFELDPSGMLIAWRVDGGPWTEVPMLPTGGDEYTAPIPGQPGGGLVDYYLEARDELGITVTLPHRAPASTFAFVVGSDVTAPQLRHGPAIDQTPGTWPPMLWAQASDNQAVASVALTFTVNDGPEQGPYPFSQVGDTWELEFPVPADDLDIGDVLQYTVTASDVATIPNTTVSGPHEVRYVDALARVLLIDDSVFRGAAEVGTATPARSVDDLLLWLEDAGYDVGVIDPGDVNGAAVQGWDVLFLYCANNLLPIGEPLLRQTMITWADAGRPILVEGGGVGERCLYGGGLYPEFAAAVLHANDWWGDFFGSLVPLAGYEDHYAIIRPHLLPDQIEPDFSSNPYDYGVSDTMLPVPDALPLLRSLYNDAVGGMLIHDNDTGPEAGQIVYITFDTSYLEPPVARPMLENALAYLTSRQAPGNASVAGTVQLQDSDDASGVTVSCGGESVTTGPDGQYIVVGLHGSTYTLTATKDGYGPVAREVTLGPDDAITGIDLVLLPVVEVQAQATPEIGIPDNDAEGVQSVIQVDAVGTLQQISVDIDISHPSIGNLTVTLASPTGTVIILHNRSGGIADDLVGNWPGTLVVDGPGSLTDLVGEDVAGTWNLRVADHQFGAVGVFHAWGLNLLVVPENILAMPDGIPGATRLMGNTPNPFNPHTVVHFELRRPGPVQLDLFDLRGRLVRRLVASDLPAGRHQVAWNGRDEDGRGLSSGVYVCRLRADGVQRHHKLMLVR